MDEQRREEAGYEKVQKIGDGVVAIVTDKDEDVEELDSNTCDDIFMRDQNNEIRNEKYQKVGDSADTIDIKDPDVKELDMGEVKNEKDQKFGETINRLRTDKDVNNQESNEDFMVDFICCCWMRRRRAPTIDIGAGGGGGYSEDVVDDLEFGRDTNRHDYFAVTPWNVYKEEDLFGLASNGGGGVSQQVSLGVFSNKGGEAVIRALAPDACNGVVAASEKPIDGEERGISPPRRWKKFWLKLT